MIFYTKSGLHEQEEYLKDPDYLMPSREYDFFFIFFRFCFSAYVIVQSLKFIHNECFFCTKAINDSTKHFKRLYLVGWVSIVVLCKRQSCLQCCDGRVSVGIGSFI